MNPMLRKNRNTYEIIKSTIERQILIKKRLQLEQTQNKHPLIIDSFTEKKIMVCHICGKSILRDLNKVDARCYLCLDDEKKWKK